MHDHLMNSKSNMVQMTHEFQVESDPSCLCVAAAWPEPDDLQNSEEMTLDTG